MADTILALLQSAALYNAAAKSLDFAANNHFLKAQATGVPLKQDSVNFNEMMGSFMGSIVLHAFALELLLKGLCMMRNIVYPKTHDLARLFALLPEEDRATAITMYEQIDRGTTDGLEAVLRANANAFEEWRYQNEYKPQTITSEQLGIAFVQLFKLTK